MESIKLEKNPDAKHYLEPGRQTEITPLIQELADAINGTFEEKIDAILEYSRSLEWDKEKQPGNFRKRTAGQILEDGFVTGCTDQALLFLAIARAAGIPSKYIEAMKIKGLQDRENNHGHVFVGVYDTKWKTIDIQDKIIGAIPEKLGFTVVAEGLDSWDIGIKDFTTLWKKFDEHRNKNS